MFVVVDMAKLEVQFIASLTRALEAGDMEMAVMLVGEKARRVTECPFCRRKLMLPVAVNPNDQMCFGCGATMGIDRGTEVPGGVR
jgi:hypothetical protein